jgi:hypothetical protein
MDTFVRRRHLLLKRVARAAMLAGAIAACSAGARAPVGVSARAPVPAGSARDGGTTRNALPDVLPADYTTTFRKLNASPALSEGHGVGRYAITIFANEAANTAFEAGHGEYPNGAVFVAEHDEHTARDVQHASTFMMEKRAGIADAGRSTWRFVAVDSEGRVAADEATGLCASCHAEAAHDGVFPLLP